MSSRRAALPFSLIGISPFARPDAALVSAVSRAGGLGVLDSGFDGVQATRSIAELVGRSSRPFGVLVRPEADLSLSSIPEDAVVVTADASTVSAWKPRTVLVQARSLDEARAAVAAGADGVIAKGSESGGPVGEETSFILLQQFAREIEIPVWVQGGVGLHTAAACIAGGAAGVVIDGQLALVKESGLGQDVRRLLSALDGSETVVLEGQRVLQRPGTTSLPESAAGATPAPLRLGADDLRTQSIPAGQDAAFARPLADRFRTAGGVTTAILQSMTNGIRSAQQSRPLAPDSPLARAHGIHYPILQGPMTRVSDRAAFADAVAHAGALPFVALSLMKGEPLRALLAETKELLGDRPWGVGILGFVPRELREEQLEAISRVKPPVALIAGGRPSQARRLEDEGVPTYLHAPSPGLLDMFLADGARHFVFEGRECGGHVGPRSSFVLWESQVERLLAFGRLDEMRIVFAGGIHDAASAAMVSALAAPLAARGAAIGILMGTAYLFTEEAVACGAIGERFQRESLECDRTVLLETAPGHATRCTDSAWARTFQAERARLLAAGLDRDAVWRELESQNVGRLRIASKGLERRGGEIVPVDEATQDREGLFMIGQAAALRDETCTMQELHEDVSVHGTELLERLRTPTQEPTAATPADVAIVGIACIFPGAANKDEFWANIVNGVDSVTEVPRDRWNPDIYYDPEAGKSGRTVSKWGGFIPPVPFDPLQYGLPPRSLASIEPVQLLSLEIARRALIDAGYGDREFDRARTSVIFGAEAGTDLSAAYGFRALYPQYVGDIPPQLDEALPALSEDSFPGVLANVISGRIANRLDLGGVNYTVDAACAASLAALDLAVKELQGGTSEMVLCGGADLHNSINDYLMFSSVRALSPTGRCRTFDATADGIVLAEGVACVALKRLSDAERDGDRVYAVIKGVAGSSDGRCLGLTAPRREGQVLALERAYAKSGIAPSEVGLVEAHGTGTIVGDRTELETLEEVFTGAGAEPQSCGLGSLKSQIGHSKCAAGLAGLIKVALSLHHRVLPPTLSLSKPNGAWKRDRSPFTLSGSSRPWSDDERRGAVSAFGFGGTNFHAVLSAADENGPQDQPAVRPFPTELHLFRGEDRGAALDRARQVRAFVTARPDARLRDVAFTLASRDQGPVQLAIVAADREELIEALDRVLDSPAESENVFLSDTLPGQVAFLFPGQGSQKPGMLADLFIGFPQLQRTLRLAERHRSKIYPPSAWSPEERSEQAAALKDTRVAQASLAMVNLAAAELLASFGIRPELLGGHSHGELVALSVAGAITDSDVVALSEIRADCILESTGDDPGTMAAVAASADAVTAALGDTETVHVANDNAPSQAVISGATAEMEEACARLKQAGFAVKPLPVACAFHGPLVAGASKTLAKHLAALSVTSPLLPVWSNTTAERHGTAPDEIRRRLAEHVGHPVRFREQIEAMHDAGARVFVEVGPGTVLTGLVRRILGERPHVAVAIDPPGQGALRGLLAALARLATLGVELDPSPLFAGCNVESLDFSQASTPKDAPWTVDGHCVRAPDGEPPLGGLRPMERPLDLSPTASAPTASAAGDRERTVLEYLANLRQLAEAQRDVMLAYLGTEAAHPATVPARTASLTARPPVIDVPAAAPVEPPVETVPPQSREVPADDLEATLLALVAEKTGYPESMLDLDLDLEAELSIDSIKRVEIIGTLATNLDLAGDGGDDERDAVVEELAACKTLREMIGWLESHRGDGESAAPGDADSAAAATALPPRTALRRYVLDVEDAPDPGEAEPITAGFNFALTDDGRGIAAHLARLLESDGATARVLGPGEEVGRVDGLVHLGPLAAEPVGDAAKALFDLAGEAVNGGARWILGATALGGSFGRGLNGDAPPMEGGVAGFLKSLSKELPSLLVRAVDVDPTDDPARIAEQLRAELRVASGPIDIGYARGVRRTLSPRPSELGSAPAPNSLELDGDSVVLLTGGARGITARVAAGLHARHGCRLELVGRTPLEESPDAEVEAARDLPALRALLAGRGDFEGPRAIENEARRILRIREIAANLAELRALGAEVRYHALDVSDSVAFGRLIDAIRAEHGRLDGVVHGAGVIEDRLLQDKTRESFDRVYDTKVAAARTLLAKLPRETRFVVFFSSIAGAFGNRGQVDYAAANDALDKLALDLDRRIDGRVVSINWGPWAGTGMISADLEAEYARRGIGLIDPEDGVGRLLDELGHGATESQVILTCAEPAQSA